MDSESSSRLFVLVRRSSCNGRIVSLETLLLCLLLSISVALHMTILVSGYNREVTSNEETPTTNHSRTDIHTQVDVHCCSSLSRLIYACGICSQLSRSQRRHCRFGLSLFCWNSVGKEEIRGAILMTLAQDVQSIPTKVVAD